MYDDDYPTCQRCFATLRIYGVPHQDVTRALRLVPSSHQGPDHKAPNRKHGWFLTSKTAVRSRDLRRHVDWILDQLVDRPETIELVRAEGAELDIFGYWVSAHGHGGPTISSEQAERLGRLKLDLGFDIFIGDKSPESESDVTA